VVMNGFQKNANSLINRFPKAAGGESCPWILKILFVVALERRSCSYKWLSDTLSC
jgi:hypothetical protein